MSLLDLKGMQHYGGMNCRLTDATKPSRKLKAGIEWLQDEDQIYTQGLSNHSILEDA